MPGLARKLFFCLLSGGRSDGEGGGAVALPVAVNDSKGELRGRGGVNGQDEFSRPEIAGVGFADAVLFEAQL